MANPDHTAHTPSSVPTEPDSTPTAPFDRPFQFLEAVKETPPTRQTALAGTSLAFVVIQGLLDYNEAFIQAQGKHPELHPWPLTQAQTNGLHAAIHFLRQYVELLKPEPGG
ncbi:hypothetical protein ISP15_05850 [Dyella jejuensis]|uniref:Uncharacterized protein n=1 Tax=Dyella jejuensis TaxID=1432009 RepID=A0ABW8JFJ1_9GAMM